MRIRAIAAEAGFVALLATFITVPSLGLGDHGAGTRADSTSGGSGNGSSGSASGGSGGSGSTGSSNSGSSGSNSSSSPAPVIPTVVPSPTLGLPSLPPGTTSGSPPPSPGHSSAPPSSSPRPSHHPPTSPAPPPPPGTVVEATLTSLPPFLLLACLIGAVAGADAVPDARDTQAMHDAAAACSNVHVSGLGNGSGLSSNTEKHPDPKDVHLTIRIRGPSSNPQIYVQQHQPDQNNKLWLTLLAALLILLAAIGTAYVIRRQRRQDGPT